MSFDPKSPVTHRSVLTVAVPIMLSNVSEPMIRVINTAVIVSLGIYMLAWWLLEARFGNHGLWAALCVFFAARSLTFASRMPALEKRAFG